MFCAEVKNTYDVEDFILSFGDKKGFYLLDGGDGTFEISPYSYIGLTPLFSVYQVGEMTYMERGRERRQINKPFLHVIKEIISERGREKGPFPFSGGFIGYLTYDFGWFLDKFKPKRLPKRVLNLPLAKFNWYEELFVFDNREKRLYFLSRDGKEVPPISLGEMTAKKLSTLVGKKPILRPSMTRKTYYKIIEKTKEYIGKGDIYQANITQRFSCAYDGAPEVFYCKLRRISPAPFGAYLREDGATVLCNSPERFLYKDGRYVETRPIKGTRKRAKDERLDALLVKELLASEKDRAEHIMIVDLERNDLGRVCETGSVKVKELLKVESYANVHHLVSVVSGVLREDKDIFDCIKNTFPGGSITGAPKLRSMEIIEELETVKRGIYCGTIGYIDASGDADLNIAIRTGVVTGGRLFFNVGGGIVADSDPEDEYEETITKAKSFLAAMDLAEVAE